MPKGRPCWLKCPKCMRGRGGDTVKAHAATGIRRTGRTKVLGTYGYRHQVAMTEVKHHCGHIWWTDHYDAQHRPLLGAP